jgi:hypothetical protein
MKRKSRRESIKLSVSTTTSITPSSILMGRQRTHTKSKKEN